MGQKSGESADAYTEDGEELRVGVKEPRHLKSWPTLEIAERSLVLICRLETLGLSEVWNAYHRLQTGICLV